MDLGQGPYTAGVPSSALNSTLRAGGVEGGDDADLLQGDIEGAWWRVALQCDFLNLASTYCVPAVCQGPCWLLGIQGA